MADETGEYVLPDDVMTVARHVAAGLLEGDSPGDTWVPPHRVLTAAADEIERLREAMTAAKTELDTEHRPEPDGRCCIVCGPQDGSWPCVSRLIADDLDAALFGSNQQPHV